VKSFCFWSKICCSATFTNETSNPFTKNRYHRYIHDKFSLKIIMQTKTVDLKKIPAWVTITNQWKNELDNDDLQFFIQFSKNFLIPALQKDTAGTKLIKQLFNLGLHPDEVTLFFANALHQKQNRVDFPQNKKQHLLKYLINNPTGISIIIGIIIVFSVHGYFILNHDRSTEVVLAYSSPLLVGSVFFVLVPIISFILRKIYKNKS
jgi:hypothetical protein